MAIGIVRSIKNMKIILLSSYEFLEMFNVIINIFVYLFIIYTTKKYACCVVMVKIH